MKKNSTYAIIIMFTALSLMLSCNDYSNPFLDIGQARASVKVKSFSDKDTVLIFSSESLSVVVFLKEHVKEVKVSIDSNRFWSGSDSILKPFSFNSEPIIIPFSFYDTGWQKIQLTTYLTNGDSVVETYSLYAKSPLYQKTIKGGAGDTAYLTTPRVKDDVLYVWDFRDGTTPIKGYDSTTIFVNKTAVQSPMGELYVEDAKERRSPSVFFSISSGTSNKLNLICTNNSIVKDSVFSNTSDFKFIVQVTGTEQLESASISNSEFDDVQNKTGYVLLSKTFHSLDTLKEPIIAVVNATDENGQTISKTFYIHYDKNVPLVDPVITVTIPATINDTANVIDSRLSMYGTITEHTQYALSYLSISINGIHVGCRTISADSTTWSYALNLNTGINNILLELLKDSTISDSKISQTAITVNYSPMPDTVAPKINQIIVNNDIIGTSKKFTTRASEVPFQIIASDNKKVSQVTINGLKAIASSDGLTFTITQSLSHSKDIPFIICAEDSAGLSVCDTIKGTFNRLPQLLPFTIPPIIIADSTYNFVIKAKDEDNDKLLLTVTIGDSIFTVNNESINWKPSIKDTGKYAVTVRVSDEFFESDDSIVNVTVIYSGGEPIPVKWLTLAKDIPDAITVGDSLTVSMEVDPLTGTKPFSYSFSVQSEGKPSSLLYEGADPKLVWAPKRSYAGINSLKFIVTDSKSASDTLTKMINVNALPVAYVSFASSSTKVNENSTRDSVSVSLSAPLKDTVKIPYRIIFDKASAADLSFDTAGIIVFKPGVSLVKMSIKPVNDSYVEGDEKYTIQLSALSVKDSIAVDTAKSRFEVTIIDDDTSAVVKNIGVMIQQSTTRGNMTIPEGQQFSGKYPAIQLTQSSPTDLVVTIKRTSASTATPTSDYTLGSTADFVVKANETITTLDFKVVDDKIHETEEFVELEIISVSGNSAAYIHDEKICKVVITDND
jgi:hypothetical protein